MTTIRNASQLLACLVLGAACSGLTSAAQSAEDDISIIGAATAGTMQASRRSPSGTERRSESVSYADLNLAADAGVRTLYARIEAAANKVCGPREDRRDFALAAAWATCHSGAMEDAVAQVNDARLAQLYRQRTGRSVDLEPRVAAAH